MNLHHILVPVDFSEGTALALDYAIALGLKFSSKITLFHVLEPITPPPDGLIMTYNPYDTAMAEEASRKLRDLAASVAGKLQVDTDQTTGIPWDRIVEKAKQRGVDLIIMPTHGRTGLKHLFLGSVAERVVRHAACPVLVVRNQQEENAT